MLLLNTYLSLIFVKLGTVFKFPAYNDFELNEQKLRDL